MGLRQRVQELEDRVGELEIARSVYDTKQMLAKAKASNDFCYVWDEVGRKWKNRVDNTPTKSPLDIEIERVQKEIDKSDTMTIGKIITLNLHLSRLLEMKRQVISRGVNMQEIILGMVIAVLGVALVVEHIREVG